MEPAFDVAPAEPRRLKGPGVVLEYGDRPLDAAAERRLHPDVDHPHPGADDRAVIDVAHVPEQPHLAEVVVAARQVEEQVANREEAQPAASPLEDVPGGEPGLPDRCVEERRRIRRWWWQGRLRLRGAACRGSRHAYSAEIR
jgi:hypothetical protein